MKVVSMNEIEILSLSYGNYVSLDDYVKLKEQNEDLKRRLNWIAFGDSPELALRYLRRIGYVDFDEERKVYINKHNNEPFFLNEEEEKSYYLKDEELSEYCEQLEYKLKQKENTNSKQALIDIRDRITHEWFKGEQLGVWKKSFQEWEMIDILQIIEEVMKENA